VWKQYSVYRIITSKTGTHRQYVRISCINNKIYDTLIFTRHRYLNILFQIPIGMSILISRQLIIHFRRLFARRREFKTVVAAATNPCTHNNKMGTYTSKAVSARARQNRVVCTWYLYHTHIERYSRIGVCVRILCLRNMYLFLAKNAPLKFSQLLLPTQKLKYV